MTPASRKRVGMGRCAATSGIVRWKAVSKQAKLGRVGECLLRLADECEGLRDVQRSEVDGGFECGEDGRCDALMLAEVRAAVYDAMADGDGRCMGEIA